MSPSEIGLTLVVVLLLGSSAWLYLHERKARKDLSKHFDEWSKKWDGWGIDREGDFADLKRRTTELEGGLADLGAWRGSLKTLILGLGAWGERLTFLEKERAALKGLDSRLGVVEKWRDGLPAMLRRDPSCGNNHQPYVYHLDEDGTEHLACRLCSTPLGTARPHLDSAAVG